MKAGLLLNRIWAYYDDFRLVKEECCADERNTYSVCSNEFLEIGFIWTEENGLFEANCA